jgi:hypothetical protein
MKWILASEKLPGYTVPAKYTDKDYHLIGFFYPTSEDEVNSPKHEHEFSAKDVSITITKKMLPRVEWLDESPTPSPGAEEMLEKYPHVTGTREGDESMVTIKRKELFNLMAEYASTSIKEGGEDQYKIWVDIWDAFTTQELSTKIFHKLKSKYHITRKPTDV